MGVCIYKGKVVSLYIKLEKEKIMNPMEYKPYADKYNAIMAWSMKVKPYMRKNEREQFVRAIVNRKYPNVLSEVAAYEKSVRERNEEYRINAYEGHEIKLLEDAIIGECFLFITNKGNEHRLKCVEMKKCEGYDWGEWCVSERSYTYLVPIFVDNNGLRKSYRGYAALINENEFAR